ncbi:MAG: glycosyltransferase family 2 protein [Campylobacterota bacterium]
MSKQTVKVSVVTIVYNAKEDLEKTIQSVLNQNYDHIEYIVIDGGSTDGTMGVIQKYAHGIDFWVSEPDNGIYDAMNKGLKAATGSYVNFLNAGDTFVDSGVVAKLSPYFENSYDLVYGGAIVKGRQGDFLLKPKNFSLFSLLLWNTRVVCHQSLFVWQGVAVSYSTKYKLKGELNWYFDLEKKVTDYKKIDDPIVFYALGGAGDVNYRQNALESIRVVFAKNPILGWISLPVIFYKYIRKVLQWSAL